MSDLTKNLKGSALSVGSVAGGVIAASIARKQVNFLAGKMGTFILIIVGLVMISMSKSDILKNLGTGIAVGGALGVAENLGLAGLDGLEGSGDLGQIVQDENGMVYMLNGDGDMIEYELPTVNGIDAYETEEALSGAWGNKPSIAVA